jgi:hypothetical protein
MKSYFSMTSMSVIGARPATKFATGGILLMAAINVAFQTDARAQDAPLASATQSLGQAALYSGGMNLTPTTAQGHSVHIMPTPRAALALPQPGLTPALSYHGGPIMPTIEIYDIFWVGTLQGGGTATLTPHYESVANAFASDYAGHSVDNNNTQYYQLSPTKYVSGLSTLAAGESLGGSYVDTDAFPPSNCTDSVTPKNCITDAQLQAEIIKVMGVKGWTGGLNKLFLVYTGQGEGSCFDSSSTSCAYRQYCAYHGFFTVGTQPVVYGNMPYMNPTFCSGGGQGFPTGDPPADAAVNVSSHETSEAITDPELNAWWDSANGEEIGDLCAWTFGTNSYDAGKANQDWNGRFYELQQEYDNYKVACVQDGPN